MQRLCLHIILTGGLLAGFSSSGACQALSPAPAPIADAPAAAAPAAVPEKETPLAVDGLGLPAQQSTLARQRGRADTVTSSATLGGSVANNTANYVVTGSNYIDNGSFANMTGIPMVIQNTGANVLIQNATVINLQMK